jgi:hypothetical protein
MMTWDNRTELAFLRPAKKAGRSRIRPLLLLVFCPLLVFGQTNNATVKYPANRYLLVVETSRSMQRRAGAMVQAVRDLLSSALANQARRGDTLGIWTFNEDVFAGLLPLQQWSPEAQKSVSDRVVGFLSAQKLEKRARFDKLVPALTRVVRNSPFITVVLVCVGEEEIHGTAFDQRINEFFQTWRSQQQDAGKPFVVVLRGQNGRFVDCSMNPSPWPAELPALPKELFIPVPLQHSLAVEPRKPATSAVPPLIISGRKRESVPSIKSAELAASSASTGGLPATNLASSSRPEPTTSVPPQGSQTTTGPPVAQTGAVVLALPVPAPTPAAAVSAQSPLATVEPQNAQRGAGPQAAAAIAANTAAVEKSATVPDSLKPAQFPNGPSQNSDVEVHSAALPQPAVPTQSKLDGDRTSMPAKSDMNARPAEVAAIASARSRSYPAIFLMAALVSFGTIAAAVWIRRRRSRSAGKVSLITESIDRHGP